MSNAKTLKLGAAFAAALALTGCDKVLPPETVQARMDQIFTEIDKLPLTTTTHSLQVWSGLADENASCAVTFTRTGGVTYKTDYSSEQRVEQLPEAVSVPCEYLEKAYDAATRDLSLSGVSFQKPYSSEGQNGQDVLMKKLQQDREEYKNKIAIGMRIRLDNLTDIGFVPPPPPFKP